MKDVKRFKHNFQRLTTIFDPSKLTTEIMDEYFEAFIDVPDYVVEEAISLAIKTWKPGFGRTFPSPVELCDMMLVIRRKQLDEKNIYSSKPNENLSTEKSREMLDLFKDLRSGKITNNEFKNKLKKISMETQ